MKKVLQVSERTVYGRHRVYPENELANQFFRLIMAGNKYPQPRKSFIEEELEIIKEMGFDIVIVPYKDKE